MKDADSVLRWWVYIIQASDGSLYTGVTTDVQRRFGEHREGRAGAKFFRGRHPVEVVYRECGHSRVTACRREAEIKGYSRARKLKLIRTAAPTGADR